MKILIAYGTTEGQTRKIARFCADLIADAGHVVELLNVRDGAELDVSRFDAAILAGSVHVLKYQDELVEFVTDNLTGLLTRPTLFLSVSLSAASDDPEELKGLDTCVRDFSRATGWTPDRVEQIAGAFRFTEYDFFRYWAMRWIASRHDEDVDPGHDKEYTDWDGLRTIVSDWCAAVSRPASPPGG